MNGLQGWCAVLDVRPHGESPVSPRTSPSRAPPTPGAAPSLLPGLLLLSPAGFAGGVPQAELGCASPGLPPQFPPLDPGLPSSRGLVQSDVEGLRPLNGLGVSPLLGPWLFLPADPCWADAWGAW